MFSPDNISAFALLSVGTDEAQFDYGDRCQRIDRLLPDGGWGQSANSPGPRNGVECLLHLQRCWLQRHRIGKLLLVLNLVLWPVLTWDKTWYCPLGLTACGEQVQDEDT